MLLRYKKTKYLIHRCGAVQNSETGQFLKPQNNGKGYLKVYLYIHGKKRSAYIHRLVAEVFVKKPRKRRCDQVNHKNGNKKDNRATNLEWMTNGENQKHAYRNGLKPNLKLSSKDITKAAKMRQKGHTFAQIADYFGVTASAVSYRIKKLKK